MVRLGQAKLNPTVSRGYELVFLAAPLLVVVAWLLGRRRDGK
jgi:hypothetical protein